MKVFTIIEMVDLDVISVRTFLDGDKANQAFEFVCEEQLVNEIDKAEWENVNTNTLCRFAGDATYSLELHETETEN